ncbi:MAG: DEAD/DEAH box helicase [Arcobacter sp.]|nr:DEAD/DEAH box helicase [Arcobacter sp.]
MQDIFYSLKNNKPKLLVVSDEKEAYKAKDCASFLGYEPFLLPDFRANYGDDLLSFSDELKAITKILEQYYLYKKKNKLLISPVRTITFPLPKEGCFEQFSLSFGDTIDINAIKDKLYNWGYVFVDIVTSEGEVSFRGDILDIFPLDREDAFRISLFDTEIESIRIFDVENQKSQKEELETISISPAFLSLGSEKFEELEERAKNSKSDAFIKDIHSLGFWYLDDLGEFYTQKLESLITKKALEEIDEVFIFNEKRIEKEAILSIKPVLSQNIYKTIEPSNKKEFLEFHKEKKITIISSTEARVRSYELPLLRDSKFPNYEVVYRDELINLLSDDELILSLNTEIKKRKKKKPKIIVDELKVGDYVVHETHGVGQFIGIEPVTVMGAKMDFVVLAYLGDDKLLVPVQIATILSGYQALLVCPTTLLASQHYEGLKKRVEKYGIKIAKLDGRTTAKEQIIIKKSLEDGTVDFVVGTHSLLNVTCKKLALIIIDEEHKFGVKQKEKLKELRSDAHIFSMSATPIPRTLNLALSKIKGMSSLTTPPSERIGVRSFVKEYDEKIIKEVILREKRRGGQIFYIYNNIATIKDKKSEILSILPNMKIEIMHSQIQPKDSIRIIEDFSDGKFDILLATSIVESGLHLPNANTMIIDGANRFGIADLHQLRGRVGRSNKEGYCYFMVQDKNKLTEDAIKRLVALESNSYLGSGTALAHQDLAIRGGGNIIGEAQSGHIENIGYALYIKMLEDAIATLGGDVQSEQKNIDIKLTISAYISSDYIREDRLRLEIYRRLSKAKDRSEIYEIQEEMEDRFGKLDIPTKQFIDLIFIKLKGLEKDIKMITNYEMNISVIYNNDKKEVLKSPSRDDDDILGTVLKFLK